MDDVRESRRLVRIYSWDVEERIPPESDARPLGQTLIEDRGEYETLTAPWRKFFNPQELSKDNKNPLEEVILIESVKLREKWGVFQNNCSKEDRLDLTKSEPTIEGVVDLVQEMMTNWASKREKGRRGKALKLFHAFCSKLDSHSSLMRLLPEGNEYVSVFTGALGAIIKASVNHEAIAEDLASSLCQISEHIIWCQAELELFHTNFMLELIVDLYAHIFLFLGSIMDWIMEKRYRRMLDSFNENFNKRFSGELGNIIHKAETLRRRAEYSSRAELRSMRLDLEELRRDFRVGLEGNARHLAERHHFEEQMIREALEAQKDREQSRVRWTQLSGFVKHMLETGAMESIHANQTVYIPIQLNQVIEPGIEGVLSRKGSQWASHEVLLSSRNLEDFFHRDRVRFSFDCAEPIMVNQDAVIALGEWFESPINSVLWLQGPNIEAEDVNNPVSMFASEVINMAERSQVPVVSYFCELRRDETLRSRNTPEIQAMLSLVYACIRQMVELLLPKFETDIDLSEGRFSRLTGTIASWPDAISILRDLITLGPDTVLCVIDGFHWLDDRSTFQYSEEFYTVLLEKRLKVLFTTTGRSACLYDNVPGPAIVDVEMSRRSDGHSALLEDFIIAS